MGAEVARVAPPESSGDPDDFRRLFDQEFGYVWRSLRRLGIPESDLEDVVHEVFLRVYQSWHRFDPSRPVRPWLFGFAYRVAYNLRGRAKNRFEILDNELEAPDASASPLDRLLEWEALSVGHRVLDRMDFEHRAVFILHDLDGNTVPEIARAFEIPLDTAYSRLRAARAQFAATLRRLKARGEVP